MTLEEKAKSYDEILEKTKQLLKTSVAYDRFTLEKLFPELKESEDERIRKFIKKQLFNIKKTITEDYELDTKLTKAIDWLEKQGEPKWREEDDSMLYTIIADFQAFKHDFPSTLEPHFNDCITWLESLKQRMEE